MSRLDPERWTDCEQPKGLGEARAAALLKGVPPPLPLSAAALERLYRRVEDCVRYSPRPRVRVPRFAVAMAIACIAPLSYAAIRTASVQGWIRSLPELWRTATSAHARARVEEPPLRAPSPVMEMPAVDLSQPDPLVSPSQTGSKPTVHAAGATSASRPPRAPLTPTLAVAATRAPEHPSAEETAEDVDSTPEPIDERAAATSTAQPTQRLCPEPPFHGAHWSKDEPADPPTVAGKLVPCDSIPKARTRSWDCEKPFGYFGSGDVHLRVAVDDRAQARRTEVIDATDSALAQAARSCAMRQAYEMGKDAAGKPVGGYTEAIHIHYQ